MNLTGRSVTVLGRRGYGGAALGEYLWRDKERLSEKKAVECAETGRGLTYGGLKRASSNLGGWLDRYHDKETPLTLLLPNSVELALCSLAAFECGVAISAVNPDSSKEELSRLLRGAEAATVVTTSTRVHTVLEARRAAAEVGGKEVPLTVIAADDKVCFNGLLYLDDLARCEPSTQSQTVSADRTALLLHSCRPGGVPLEVSHSNLVATCEQLSAACPLRETASVAALPPMFHYFGFAAVLLHGLASGAELLTMSTFRAEPWLAVIKQRRVAVLPALPSTLEHLTSGAVSDEDMTSLETVIVGEAGTGRLLEVLPPGVAVTRLYGPAWGPPVLHRPDSCKKTDSLGTPLPGTEAKVLEAGEELPTRAEGEIWVRGPQLPHPGWIPTGDIGYRDKEGYFYLTRPAEDCLSLDGLILCPSELESVLRSHPQVRDAAVLPEDTGLVGLVVPRDLAQPPPDRELLNFLGSKLAPYKRLSALHYLPHIPRDPQGRLDKVSLRLHSYNKEYVALTSV